MPLVRSSGGGSGNGYYEYVTSLPSNTWTLVECGFEPDRANITLISGSATQSYDFDVKNQILHRATGSTIDQDAQGLLGDYIKSSGTQIGLYNYNGGFGSAMKVLAMKEA